MRLIIWTTDTGRTPIDLGSTLRTVELVLIRAKMFKGNDFLNFFVALISSSA